MERQLIQIGKDRKAGIRKSSREFNQMVNREGRRREANVRNWKQIRINLGLNVD